MNQTREEYLMKHAEHAQRLDDLAGELQTLDLSEINQKVGGLRSSIKHANVNLLFTYFLFGWSRCCHTPLKRGFLVWFLQVCGSLSSGQDSCSSSPCGGLGCTDSEGRPKCGGEGCDGVVAKASSNLRKAQDTEQEIINAMDEVEKLSKKVSLDTSDVSWSFLDLIVI